MRGTSNRSGGIWRGLLLCSISIAVATNAWAEQPLVDRRPMVAPADLKAAAEANGRFAVDLYQRLAESESGKVLFLSPFSISLALTMVAEGAVDETLDQMTEVLHVPKGDLARMHTGQGGLQRSAIPDIPPEVTKRIASLRAKLKDANRRSVAFETAGRHDQAMSSYEVASKLADEINDLNRKTAAYELQIANALWLEKSYPIEPTFISALTPSYGASVFPVDFKRQADPTRRQINQWVASQTHDRIKDLLGPQSITDLTKLLITNAVYFKGDWAKPFNPSSTRSQPFHLANSRSKDVAMMHQWNGDSASYGAFDANGDLFPTPKEIDSALKDDDPSLYPDSKGHTALSLDYQGRKIHMILLVPQSATGLAELERSLTYEKLQRWIKQMEDRTIDVTIPKFKLEANYSLRQTLEAMGMVRAFAAPSSNREGAQFDKLSSSQRPDERPFISQVVHKTFLEVNEIGTEAAVATAVSISVEAAPRPFNPIFNANKPFLFLIRDRETDSILFMGRYVGPE